MLVAQWIPRNGQHVGPISTGPAVALLWVGGVVLLAAVAAALQSRGQRRQRSSGAFPGWLAGLGLSLCALGGFALLVRHSEDQQVSDGLHTAAQQVISTAVDSARNCATAAPEPVVTYPSGLVPGGATTFTPPPCSTSPRSASIDSTVLTYLGGYRAQQSAAFDTNGHVTVTDPTTGKQVCATVPDSADSAGTVVDGACAG
ncbi:hypothetical protein [Streptacidiphilus sp. MAP12-20]|uniref:hypothetical protein n=1 Tax=Streptacidiphilus sp. MAP12-20 TaxID=3156299 RepID=UPI0035186041